MHEENSDVFICRPFADANIGGFLRITRKKSIYGHIPESNCLWPGSGF